MNKNAQITIFVILGITLVIVVGLFLAIRNTSISKEPDIDEIIEIPTGFGHVKEYVENCLSEISKEAIIEISSHGGYINPQEFGFYAVEGFPTSSTALEVFPESGELVPYWYHLKSSSSCSNCLFEINIPSLKGRSSRSIKSQLNNYIINNLNECVKDLEMFENEFDNIEIGEVLKPETFFSDSDTQIILEWPISIKKGDQTISINNFQTKLNIKLKRLYELATSLLSQLELENNTNTFEKFTMDIINTYSIGSNPPLPPSTPFIDLEFTAPTIWMYQSVEQKIIELLSENVPFNQIIGSNEYMIYMTNDTFANNMYNQFGINIFFDPVQLSLIKINFQYLPWWPIYLDINPGGRGAIMPETYFSNFIIPISLTTYDFSYDLSYPILVTLEDKTAFDGEGYTLQFAFEVNVRNNAPLKSGQIDLDEIEQEDSTVNSPFMNLNQRTSGNITIKTIDVDTNLPLDDVIVMFNCLEESIILGNSRIIDGEAQIIAKLPICIGGIIEGFKEDYIVTPATLSTQINVSETVILKLEKLKSLSLNLKKYSLIKLHTDWGQMIGWNFNDESLYLADDERVILIMTRQKNSPNEEDFTKFYQIKGSDEDTPIELISGQYKIEAFVTLELGENFSRQEIVIPEKEICYDPGIFQDEECTTIEEIVFNSTLFIGGVKFDETSGFVNITTEDLQNDEMILHVIVPDVDDWTEVEDLESLTMYENHSITYHEILLPIFQ